MDETSAVSSPPVASPSATDAAESTHHLKAFQDGDDSPSFMDVLDTLNPLQHIPVISTIYRELTDDEPGAVSRLLGGALYGGPIGLALASIDSIIDDQTGKDTGEHVWAAIMGDDDPTQAPTAVADAVPETPAPADSNPPAPAAAPLVAVTAVPLAANVNVKAPAPPPQLAAATAPINTSKLTAATTTAAAAPATPPPAVDGATALPPGFMPAPNRRAIQVVQPLPPTGTISTSGQRSNTPAVGHILPTPGSDPVPQTQNTTMANASPNGWFPSAMADGLEKYQRMNKITQAAQASAVPPPAAAAAQPGL